MAPDKSVDEVAFSTKFMQASCVASSIDFELTCLRLNDIEHVVEHLEASLKGIVGVIVPVFPPPPSSPRLEAWGYLVRFTSACA